MLQQRESVGVPFDRVAVDAYVRTPPHFLAPRHRQIESVEKQQSQCHRPPVKHDHPIAPGRASSGPSKRTSWVNTRWLPACPPTDAALGLLIVLIATMAGCSRADR